MGGGDKALLPLLGRPMLAHLLARLAPQVDALALSANGDPARFREAAPGMAVVADPLPSHPGPLAGILAGMERAAGLGMGWVLSVPGDTPLVPSDLAARLGAALEGSGAAIACAASGGRAHPPVALWPVGLRGDLRRALLAGEGKVSRWAAPHGVATVEWAGDPFLNANAPADLPVLEAALRGQNSPA
ncbi:molybdenum cofactor guanylyltransferase [Roseomonas nepalensis]|uniref:Molybdenum cofactor guanylyltransferase n=2 Tax=Muricoccus nepalensis TaxID=1854500 RepID=A0A502GD75_9PROT|nr:molybdenum cofactor guanylyltransferase [Roseomonas nepalensis]